jgi:hypothetical protein
LLGHDRTSAVTEGFNTPPDFQSEFAAESLSTESGQAGAGRVNYVDEPCGMIPFIIFTPKKSEKRLIRRKRCQLLFTLQLRKNLTTEYTEEKKIFVLKLRVYSVVNIPARYLHAACPTHSVYVTANGTTEFE